MGRESGCVRVMAIVHRYRVHTRVGRGSVDSHGESIVIVVMTKFGVGISADVTSSEVTSNIGVFKSIVYAFGFGYTDASLSPESMSIVCMAMLLIYLEIILHYIPL